MTFDSLYALFSGQCHVHVYYFHKKTPLCRFMNICVQCQKMYIYKFVAS